MALTESELYEKAYPNVLPDSQLPEDVLAAREYKEYVDHMVALASQTASRYFGGDKAAHFRHRAGLIAEAVSKDATSVAHVYTEEDVLGWAKLAVDMGAALPQFGPKLVEDVLYLRKVPNAIFRERAYAIMDESMGDTPSLDDIALRAGHVRVKAGGEKAGNTQELANLIGLTTIKQSYGNPPYLRLFVSYDQALTLARAFELDLHDVGI